MSTVRVPSVSTLPIIAIVVLLSVKKTKHLPRPPSVCPPPLSGLCWFNPGGQQAGLTAPRHYHVIYGELWERRGDDHSDLTPVILSATHHEAENTRDLLSFTHPDHEPSHQLVTEVSLSRRSCRDSNTRFYMVVKIKHNIHLILYIIYFFI